jgi:hypothetical protein
MPTQTRLIAAPHVADILLQGIQVGQNFRTPDDVKGRSFTVVEVHQDSYTVETQSGISRIRINRASIERAYQHLLDSKAMPERPTAIESNKEWDLAGPLCRAARGPRGSQMIITYILPPLAQLGIVGINGAQPNTTWIIPPRSM